MDDRGHLTTEQRNPQSKRLDRMSTEEAFDLINAEDAGIAAAVADAREEICRAIELVAGAFQAGGGLVYVGAGTSGRLAVLDATECPPTFLSPPSTVQGVIAGGHEALTRSIEGAEDSPLDGAAAIDQRDVGAEDVVFGIATGGTTPFVHGALQRSRQRGAKTVFLGCVPKEQVVDEADVSIRVVTGPEVLTGSTRMKAGTATKMVLNMVTTIAMVRVGKTYENLMVDVNTGANAKLVDRGTRIIQTVSGLSRDESRRLLDNAGGHVKTALVMNAKGVDCETAKCLLEEQGGHVAKVIDRSSIRDAGM
ncbi:MAG: N-acetylmuramic acid 6-phosphate etherase [Phycisphaerales bacterium]|nr:MAG: N-acetylmuramic acid 6-phosphate etherase [Phycisphaerales bacterium]